MPTLAASFAAFHDWMWRDALPFWAHAGVDEAGLGFHEALALDGAPFASPFKRVRVQARQIYVFCQAERLGWPGGLHVARRGYDFLRRHARLPSGGWARLLGPAGGVLDGRPDLYDVAFVVLALSWFARVSGEAEPLELARDTVDWLWTAMAAPEGGFENALPPDSGPRQQNPHMHLLEALLALYETAPDPVTAARIDALVDLFRHRLFDPGTATLGEHFTRALAPLEDRVEPGHQFEWAWLLHEHARLRGGPVLSEARRLYDFASAGALLPVNAVDRTGRVLDTGRRLWPLTEAIRADIVWGAPEALVAQRTGALLTRFLHRPPPGTWVDTQDADGRDMLGRIPGSTFYHLMGAFAELHRAVQPDAPRPGTPRTHGGAAGG